MEILRELNVIGPEDRLLSVINDITDAANDGWRRDVEREEDLSRRIGQNRFFCFTCAGPPAPKPSALWLAIKKRDHLYVSNIVPDEVGSLSRKEYNAILMDFYERFVRTAAANRELTIEIGPGEVDLEHWLSEGTSNRLRTFSACANKSTGASHPLDRERWNQFIFAAHRESAGFDSSTLVRWLHEEAGWAESMSSDLAIQYDRARLLLKDYDEFLHGGNA